MSASLRGLVASSASPLYNGPMPTLNERQHELCDAMAADADQLGIAVSVLPCGTRIIDCGVKAPGSVEAGRRLAHICLSGLGDVYISAHRSKLPSTSQEVSVATKAPIARAWRRNTPVGKSGMSVTHGTNSRPLRNGFVRLNGVAAKPFTRNQVR